MLARVTITDNGRVYVVSATEEAKIRINGQGKMIYVSPSNTLTRNKGELRYIEVYDLNGNPIDRVYAKSAPAKQAETAPREPVAAPAATSSPATVQEPPQPTRNEPKAETRQKTKPTPKPVEAAPRPSEPSMAISAARKTIGAEELKNAFHAYLQDIPFYNEANVSAREDIVHDHIRQLSKLDSEQKEKYARENDIQKKLTEQERELMQTRSQTEQVLENFIADYSDYDITNKQEALDELRQMLKKRQRDWDDRLDELADASRLTYNRQTDTTGWVTVAIMLALVALLAGCGWWLYRRSRSPRHVTQPGRATQSTAQPGGTPAGTGGENIVVRRRTTSVLKKQSLDDVVGNDSYLCIETPDFCSESAVRRIYIKNTCIKDIYNMYAEDPTTGETHSLFEDLVVGAAYKFKAIVQRPEPAPKNSSLKEGETGHTPGGYTSDGSYKVYPFDFDPGDKDNIITAVESVDVGNGQVKSVKYVNVAGIVSDRPFQGVNIVVKERTDGSKVVTKIVR